MKIRGQWKPGTTIGGCSTCSALKVDAASGAYTNEVEVFELCIGSTGVRLCAPCLDIVSGVIALGKRERVLGTNNS